MRNPHNCLLIALFLTQMAIGQNDTIVDKGVDSIKTDLKKSGFTIQKGEFKKVEINPLAPSKAAFYSAMLPGLGQIYNKRYWKAPIVWGALGLSIYSYTVNNNDYNTFRDAFKRRRAGFTDDEFYARNNGEIIPGQPRVSNTALEDAQERAQRNRDLALLITIGLYALNVIDANVDAHLKQFNVSDELSFDMKPYLELNEINGNANYGLAMQIKF